MRIGDLILGACVLFLMIFLILPTKNLSDEEKEIVIYVDGEVYERISYGSDSVHVIETEHGYNKIVTNQEGVFIEEADCPDHDCMNIGLISHVGHQIICAPHLVVIEIIGGNPAIDAVS